MKDELYKQALSFFNSGDYEKALNTLKQGETQISSMKERQLINQCEKQIAEQYYYLIHEYIQQEDYLNANALKEEYNVKFGYNPRITDIKIPEKKVVPPKQIITIEEEEEEKRFPYGWLITLIVLLVFFGFLYWQYNRGTNTTSSNQEQFQEKTKSESESFEERSEAIIAQLTEEYGDKIKIIGKYPELSEYIAFVAGESRLILNNVEGKQQKEFDFPLRLGNSDRCGIPTQAFDSNDKSKILIIGENGGNEFADMAFLLEYDPSTDKIRELGWGLNLERQANRIKITRRWTTYCDEENYNHEYAFIDIYYDLNGNPIPSPFQGKNYHFKGKIDSQYPVMMSLSIKDDKICGAYYYEKKGSANKLYLYGGISESSDIVLLEFNSEAEQTGTFFGRIVDNTFSGTFTNNARVEMPFSLEKKTGSSSTSTNNIQSSGKTSTTYIPDRDAEFPGGMVGLGQYITENLQYPITAKEKGISGDVRVSYIIDKDGSIIDVKVIESVDPDLDKEAVRLISSMPKWKPGIRKSKYVKMRTSTVIRFELE